MNKEQTRQVRKYLGLILLRKKLIITCCLLALFAGLGAYLKTPKEYRATSILIYQTQTINPNQRVLDDDRRLRDMVNTVAEQVSSRASLEKIITQHKLYENMLQKAPMAEVVKFMRSHIKTELERGDVFKISFVGPNPQDVMMITNALAARFIEENLRFREERASEAFIYVKDELRMAKDSLDKKEAIMRDYKLQYYNELPQQLQNNMSRLNSLQNQYQSNQNSIQELERTKILIQEQITLRREMMAQQDQWTQTHGSTFPGGDQAMGRQQPTGLQDIEQTRRDLEALKSRYTANHPDVKRAEKILQNLEEFKNKRRKMEITKGQEDQENIENQRATPQLDQMILQLHDSEYSIKRLKEERLAILAQIELYQNYISATPVREAEWTALTRDYNQLSAHYQKLVAQKLQAESAETLERRQKGSQFKIIDPANLPNKPFNPDFKRIMLIALGLSLVCGAGLAYALEEGLNSSFRDPDELEAFVELPVTCSIPLILTPQEKRRKTIAAVLWTFLFFITSTLLICSVIYFLKTGEIIL